MEIEINTPQGIPRILDEVHDKWFDLERIKLAASENVLRIPISSTQTTLVKGQNANEFLIIGNVVRVEIQDTERIGCYDIADIKFDSAARRIDILSGIPLGLSIFVSSFSLTYARLA